MIGERYWATGITVKADLEGRWSAVCDYYDDGFCEDASTEGRLQSRYRVAPTDGRDALAYVIDLVKADAERLGISFDAPAGEAPFLYYSHDGEDEEWPPPDGWRELLRVQAERLGWRTYATAFEPEGAER